MTVNSHSANPTNSLNLPALLGRYHRLIRIAFTVILMLVAGLFQMQFNQRLDAELQRLGRDLHERADFLNYQLHDVADHVATLRLHAETYYQVKPAATLFTPVLTHLFAASGTPNLDDPPPPYTRAMLGNLKLAVPVLDAPIRRELDMALSLSSQFQASKSNLPGLTWVYYASERLAYIYPWVPAHQLSSVSAAFLAQFPHSWRTGIPSIEWTPVYRDDWGQGLMVTCAAPVDENGQWRGLVAIDLTLTTLNPLLDTAYPAELVWISNAQQQVVAHSANAVMVPDDSGIVRIAQLIPADWMVRWPDLLRASEGQWMSMDGYYLYSLALEPPSWRLVALTPRTAVWRNVLSQGSIVTVALLLGLTGMLVLAHRLSQREFIAPAEQLMRHLEAESRGMVPPMSPTVPDPWRPWFAQVDTLLREYGQLIALRQDLEVARRIQYSFLPPAWATPHPRCQLSARMVPAREVGGDFYDFFWLDAEHLGIVIGDVAGKGIPAALFMAVTCYLLRAIAPGAAGPAACLQTLNRLLCARNESDLFVTVFYGVLDLHGSELCYASGGHGPPCWIQASGELNWLQGGHGAALGFLPDLALEQATVQLQAGDLLFLYTDGVTEAIDGAQQEYGEERLLATLHETRALPASAIVDTVFDAVARFSTGLPPADDITALALRLVSVAIAVPGGQDGTVSAQQLE